MNNKINTVDPAIFAGLTPLVVDRFEVIRWTGYHSSEVLAIERKGLVPVAKPGYFPAFSIINFVLANTTPGTETHNRVVSWAKYLVTGERDPWYVRDQAEQAQYEAEQRELNKTPPQKLDDARHALGEVEAKVRASEAQIAAFESAIAQATEGIQQHKSKLASLSEDQKALRTRVAQAEKAHNESLNPTPTPTKITKASANRRQ
jgi:hypothetical protein